MEIQSLRKTLSWFKPYSYITALILITLLGAGLRLYKLGDYPGGFGQDEAVGAYDAWSLLTTGREHHGDFWPLSSRQFGDYPPSTPTFLTIPFIALLGPTELATRLPCALLNAAAVFFFGSGRRVCLLQACWLCLPGISIFQDLPSA
jgi:4-amino-4-deoxy-L-arabinose transferase-like glycosyltransferase